jgi:hypothetical protein
MRPELALRERGYIVLATPVIAALRNPSEGVREGLAEAESRPPAAKTGRWSLIPRLHLSPSTFSHCENTPLSHALTPLADKLCKPGDSGIHGDLHQASFLQRPDHLGGEVSDQPRLFPKGNIGRCYARRFA